MNRLEFLPVGAAPPRPKADDTSAGRGRAAPAASFRADANHSNTTFGLSPSKARALTPSPVQHRYQHFDKLSANVGYRWIATLLAALFFTTFAHAAAERLDDSMSPRSSVEPTVTTTNGSVFDGAAPTEAALQFGWVEYRLNTAKYLGKNARIYYVVPAAIGNLRSPSGLRVEWRGRNTFKSGSARAGERILVWSGVVVTPRMEDAFDLKMGLVLSEMQGPIRFESYFEIEVN
jgi:hypothetical protein